MRVLGAATGVRRGVWVPLAGGVSYWGQWGLSISYWSQWGPLTSSHWGGNGVCAKTSYWGDRSE